VTGATGGPEDLRRVLMDRARAQAERDRAKAPRRVVPLVVAAIAAVALVAMVMLGFDAFLTSMQKFLDLPVTDPEPPATEPMPAFVVTEESPGTTAAPAEPAASDAPAAQER
jgi:hypothetical protein